MLTDVRLPATGVVGAALIVTAVVSAQPPPEPTADGWTISASGQISAPIDLQTRRFEAEYDASWHPRRLTIEGTRAGTTFVLRTTFADGTAANEVEQGARHTSNEDSVDPDAVAGCRRRRGSGG